MLLLFWRAAEMATVDDVEQTLCQAIAGFMFPGMAYQPLSQANCIAPSISSPGAPSITIPVVLGVGTPTIEDVDAKINNGISIVSVTQMRGWSRNTTRFFPQRIKTSMNFATITAALESGVVTFGGIGSPNQIVSVLAGDTYYAYLAGADDTPATIAAAMAAQIPGGQSDGAVLTGFDIKSVNIAPWQTGLFQVGTKEESYQVIIFATPCGDTDATNGYAVRAALGSMVSGLQRLQRPNGTYTQWIGLPDGSQARVRFDRQQDDDTPKRFGIWRRWIHYRVEYDETIVENWPTLLAPLIIGVTDRVRIRWFGPGAPSSVLLTNGHGNLLTDAAGDILGSL